jgi:hypothetical protein
MVTRIALILGLLAGSAGLALADSSPDKAPPAGSLTVTQVTQRLQSQGFTVSKVKFDDGRYKVKATDAAGHKEKLDVSPATGDVVSKGKDDDDD